MYWKDFSITFKTRDEMPGKFTSSAFPFMSRIGGDYKMPHFMNLVGTTCLRNTAGNLTSSYSF